MNKLARSSMIGVWTLGAILHPGLSSAAAKGKQAVPTATATVVQVVKPAKAKGPTSAYLAKTVQAAAYDKSTGAISKVKRLVKKSSQTVTVKCTFTNKSRKTVRAVRGWIRFVTFFNESIYDLSLEAVMPIGPGEEADMDWKLKVEDFPSKEVFEKFRATPLEEMKQIWVPQVIVFEDGTSMQAK